MAKENIKQKGKDNNMQYFIDSSAKSLKANKKEQLVSRYGIVISIRRQGFNSPSYQHVVFLSKILFPLP